ncbi:hypothetical protein GDO81_018179 [Engystomops pustulosus]|uniref:Uncharacterized protein n=1 Tax=Engystomops pustulosus TaxID=76066 RepID=A0AAV7A528_ENGPU|nr:hypothetical protein GDO81_018179 [Engystomops pustulosus]
MPLYLKLLCYITVQRRADTELTRGISKGLGNRQYPRDVCYSICNLQVQSFQSYSHTNIFYMMLHDGEGVTFHSLSTSKNLTNVPCWYRIYTLIHYNRVYN